MQSETTLKTTTPDVTTLLHWPQSEAWTHDARFHDLPDTDLASDWSSVNARLADVIDHIRLSCAMREGVIATRNRNLRQRFPHNERATPEERVLRSIFRRDEPDEAQLRVLSNLNTLSCVEVLFVFLEWALKMVRENVLGTPEEEVTAARNANDHLREVKKALFPHWAPDGSLQKELLDFRKPLRNNWVHGVGSLESDFEAHLNQFCIERAIASVVGTMRSLERALLDTSRLA